MARFRDFNLGTPEWFREIERSLRSVQDRLAPYEEIRRACTLSMEAVLDTALIRELSIIRQSIFPQLLTDMQTVLNKFENTLLKNTVSAAKLGAWSATVFDRSLLLASPSMQLLNDMAANLSATAIRIADWLPGTVEDPVELQELSENEKQEIAAEVTDILSDEQNWEQRLFARIDNFTKEHPVWAYVIKGIFITLILGIIQEVASTYIGQLMKPAQVYEEPAASSPTIYRIEQNQSIYIINVVPYYYQIELKDPSTEQIISGYVSKRSVQLQATDEDTDTVELNEESRE